MYPSELETVTLSQVLSNECFVHTPVDDLKRNFFPKLDHPMKVADWMQNRWAKQKDLTSYVREHPKRFELVRLMMMYVYLTIFWDHESKFGGSTELREWYRIDAPERRSTIKNFAKEHSCEDEIGQIFAKIFLALPEIFVATTSSHPQERLNDSYAKIGEGDYTFFKPMLEEFSK